MRIVLHIDFNSYFATVEQQANPRLRGKPIGVTGGDRMSRTVLGTASVEAKRLGVKTGMSIPQALKIYPQLILVKGDSDKYMECTKRFLALLKKHSPNLEVFSIDETFLQLAPPKDNWQAAIKVAEQIKADIRSSLGGWVSCSIGISYSRIMAKLASGLYKPDGLNVIADAQAAIQVLDQVELDEVCGIGYRIKHRLQAMGVTNFKLLRQIPLPSLLAGFKSYGQILYNLSRGIDSTAIVRYFEKEEVKSIGHQHTISHDTSSLLEIKQLLLKMTELVARRLRRKKLLAKTVHLWFRRADFSGEGMQSTVAATDDGLLLFEAAWRSLSKLWQGERLRLVSVTAANLVSGQNQSLSLLEDDRRQQKIVAAIDRVNDCFGEFTLQRGILLGSGTVARRANPFLSDRRFKV